MPKPIVVTLLLIAMALGALSWWWFVNKGAPKEAVFVNETPDLSTISPESPEDKPASPENVQEEIQNIEEAKEKEFLAPAPSDAPSASRSSIASPSITSRLIDWGYASKSGRNIDTIVLHSSYNSLGGDEYSVEKIIAIYKDYGVGAHYLIDRKGKIYRLIEDEDIAYHAGASKMPDGRTNVNDFSLGIELVNNMEDGYTKAQYEAVNDLFDYLKNTYPIKHVVGHSDIAPGRKTDPWNFDWKKLKE